MKNSAFMFPGQASQYVGMAKDLFEEFNSAREMFEMASDILKYDLAKVCFEGPEEKLRQTAFTQPAVFVHSCVLDMILRENGVKVDAAAGHSLGEYTALVSSGSLDFQTAMAAVAKRSAAMQADCDENPGTMAAVLGMEYDAIVSTLREVNGIVVPANYNSPDQIVISGEKGAVEAACERLKQSGAKRAMPIAVGGAYHSPLMTKSSQIMKEYIPNLPFGEDAFPVYSNVSGEPAADPASYVDLLSRQITSPVLWYPTVQNMHRDGIRRFIEVGPGKVLQGLAKRSLSDPEIEIDGVDTLDDLDRFLNQNAKVATS